MTRKYAVVFVYEVDSQGVYHNDIEDLLSVTVVNTHLKDIQHIQQVGLLDSMLEGLKHGTNTKFEVFNVLFLGDSTVVEDVLMDKIKEDMVFMIENKELDYDSDFEFYLTVTTD